MSTVAEYADALAEALRGVEGVRFTTDWGAAMSPPAALLLPPRLEWKGAYCSAPTSATFLAVVVVAADERAPERLWELAPRVAAAIDAVPDAVVKQADPGVWRNNGHDLPSYEFTIEVAL